MKQNLKVVTNMNTLKAMERRDLIVFDEQTGTKITELYRDTLFTCYYIWEGKDGIRKFKYKGNQYRIEYVSGCFKPYVFKVVPVTELQLTDIIGHNNREHIRFDEEEQTIHYDPDKPKSLHAKNYAIQEIEGLKTKKISYENYN